MNPIEWLSAWAPGFAELTEPERDAIMQFSLLWSWFEGQALDTNADAEKLIALAERLKTHGLVTPDTFTDQLAYFRNRYFQNGALTDLFDGPNGLHFPNNKQRALAEAVVRAQTNDPAELTTGLLIIIYRIRNNLFHGTKWAEDIRTQFGNFTYANTILMRIMERFFQLPP